MRRSTPWAVIAGGGTAGHVVPALAVARALVADGHDPATIHFVGSRRGVEARLVPAAGFAITLLPGRGLVRRLSAANLVAAAGLAAAFVRAVGLLARRRPAVVLSVGGYAGAPTALAAAALRIPLVLADSNAVPGAANRLVGRVARASAVAFPGVALPRATVTGNPVRPEVLAVQRTPESRAKARAGLGLPAEASVVAAFGGSLGAGRINAAVASLVDLWSDRADVAVRHAVGRREWTASRASAAHLPPEGLVYQAVEYEDRMDQVYEAADVMVTRAGGSTVAELAVAGLPAVLVPLPGAPGDHQTANARALAEAGAAIVLADDACTGARLAQVLDPLLADPAHLAAMGAAARATGRRDAAQRVAALLEAHAR